jgi:importin subunit beta-1
MLQVAATLGSSQLDARHTAAQVISAIAQIELPNGLWNDLIQMLLKNMESDNQALKQSTLEALGYICEQIVSRDYLLNRLNHNYISKNFK